MACGSCGKPNPTTMRQAFLGTAQPDNNTQGVYRPGPQPQVEAYVAMSMAEPFIRPPYNDSAIETPPELASTTVPVEEDPPVVVMVIDDTGMARPAEPGEAIVIDAQGLPRLAKA